ncbi:exodeoxyribonuclease VII small subunit [Corynebacterium matruchotii]|jgi:exodeoxyribonuclease VII, small subunit|uniref:exodeoxyribonuclease VII small subunit n=1 Tax=Corynebacterium matruchotii TaxID=43768 RepID=UPI0028EBE3DC|nr:exodeoxyribonuclease VII small subunit [Corynebacterium matruchotii]
MSTTVFGQGTGDNAFDPVESLNYEQARDELIEVVRILELGQMGLDESLKYWERGEALAKRCEEHLAGAARRVEAAIQGTTKTTENDGNSGNSRAETAETPGSTSAAGSTGGADGERTTGVAEGDSTASYYGSF